MDNKLYKVELHVHTHFSYDTQNYFHRIIKKVKDKSIDAIAVCDHNEIEGAIRLSKIAPFKVIVGEEIMTTKGEIIGLFLTSYVKPGMSPAKTIQEIKRQGGIVYLPHPFDTTTRSSALSSQSRERYIKDIDIVEIHNGRNVKDTDNKKAGKFALEHGKYVAVGSDAHTSAEIGRNYLIMKEFTNQKSFLNSLKTARLITSRPLYPAFLQTKVERRYKKISKVNYKESNDFICDTCDSHQYKILYKKKGIPKDHYLVTDDSYGVHGQIVQCRACQLKQVFPMETKAKIEKRYESFIDPSYQIEIRSRAENQKRVLAKIDSLKQDKGKLLDIGCATGAFLDIAKKDSWNVYGVEPSKWARKVARNTYNIRTILSSIDSTKLKEKSFDVITMIDVIEHVHSPDMYISRIRKLLKDDGILVIVTPNSGSIVARMLGERWWHIRPDHIYYFSKATLYELLSKNTFQCSKFDTYAWTFSVDYWASRVFSYVPFFKPLYKIVNILTNNKLGKYTIKLNFHDSSVVYASKY